MQPQVVAVNANGHDMSKPRPGEPPAEPAAAPPARRFFYASGAKPLTGYTIKRGVGQGGFGDVYYAVSDAGKEVALKLIRRNLDVELRGIRQCLNLKHPNLLSLFDIRQDDQGDTWVVMEYVAGDCLETLLEAKPHGLPPSAALAWIHGIGRAVAYLHDHGIVHRDLKPGNVFCDEGVVKVGDYGLSKFISCSRRSGHTESVGTVHYMAPEVANGRYGKEIDVYAMGVMLYETLTGRVPFEGESVGEVLMKHLTARPDVSMLSEPYRSVVARALEKDPALRYRTAGELLAALPPPGKTPAYEPRPDAPAAGGETAPATGAAQPQVADGIPSVSDVVTMDYPHEHVAGGASRSPLPPRDRVNESPPPPGDGVHGSPLPSGDGQRVRADEEPIMRAIRDGVSAARRGTAQLRRSWDEAKLNTPMKIFVILVAAFVIVNLAPFVVAIVAIAGGLAIPLLILYGIYRLIWWLVVGKRGSAGSVGRAAAAAAASVAARRAASRHARHRGYETPAAAMVVKPARQRITELIGSLLGSALVAAVTCVVMMLIYSHGRTALRPERVAWLLLTSTAGAWAILIPAKLWEGTRGEPSVRRFVMMVAGLAVGMLACVAADALLVDLPASSGLPFVPHLFHFNRDPALYAADGRPLMLAYAAAFATLFLLLRWWRQTDPLRRKQLSLGSLIVCAILASLVADLWQFPQPWLPMAAAAISISVQLASPWAYSGRRGRQEGR